MHPQNNSRDGEMREGLLEEFRVHIGSAPFTEILVRYLIHRAVAHAVAMLPGVTHFTHGHVFTSIILPFWSRSTPGVIYE